MTAVVAGLQVKQWCTTLSPPLTILSRSNQFSLCALLQSASFIQVYETPFFVAVDHEKKKVVISIRGTLSPKVTFFLKFLWLFKSSSKALKILSDPILFSSSQQHHLQSRWSSHGLVFSNSYTFSHIEQKQDCPPSEINVLSAFFFISICENSWAVLKLNWTISWEINHGFIIKANWLLRGSSLLIPLSFAPS